MSQKTEFFPADYVLPCDVAVAPATHILKGCTLGTLMQSIALREKDSPVDIDRDAVRNLMNPSTCSGPEEGFPVSVLHRQQSRPLTGRDMMAALGFTASPLPTGVAEVLAELARATQKFPTWPTDPLHAAAVVGEEAGELVQAVLQAVYEPHKSTPADVRAEAVQVGAMAIRFLASMDRYAFVRGEQHLQDAAGQTGAGCGG